MTIAERFKELKRGVTVHVNRQGDPLYYEFADGSLYSAWSGTTYRSFECLKDMLMDDFTDAELAAMSDLASMVHFIHGRD